MGYEPQLGIHYGTAVIRGTGKRVPVIEVTNEGDRPIDKLIVEWVFDFEQPQEATEKFVSEVGPVLPGNHIVRSAKETVRRYPFKPQASDDGPLPVGKTRTFALHPGSVPEVLSFVHSLSPERYYVTVISDGHKDIAVTGDVIGGYVADQFTEGD